MAKGLQLRVLAENVETMDQFYTLQDNQCSEMQGYLFSQPVPANMLESLMQKKILLPVDSNKLVKRNRRKHPRFKFPTPLEADIKLTSIANRKMEVGVSKVLVENISVGGLRFVSNLNLPIRRDVIYRFITNILGKPLEINGRIAWKREVNEEITEYGVQFIFENEEQDSLSTLLHSFDTLLKNKKDSYPPYRKANVLDRIEYFSKIKN